MKFLSPKQKYKLLATLEILRPYKDIIIFVVVLFASNLFWKYTVCGDEDGLEVTWLGLTITAPFEWTAEIITDAVFWIISQFRDTIYQVDAVSLCFTSGNSAKIIWGCTPIKQSFIWLCVMLATTGDWKSKSWFIPLGWAVLFAFNIIRISIITLFIEFHPEWFDFLHTYFFKYLFYAFMFLLWVWYVEKVCIKQL